MDKLELYRWAVQDPETHAIVLSTMYQQLRHGRQPLVLREDFAGTSAESVAWVALRRGRRAIAVDIDGPTVEWARRRASRLLGSLAPAVEFVLGDVRRIGPPDVDLADIISVLNFSILFQRDQESLEAYLRQARNGLATEGILVFNVFGGEDNLCPGKTIRHVTPRVLLPGEVPCQEFDYTWEVRFHDRVLKQLDCRIHFSIPDASDRGRNHEMLDAFQYDWRLWSLQELIDACCRAGFSAVQIWRHTYDPSMGEAGVFLGRVEPDSLLALPNWEAYVVACR